MGKYSRALNEQRDGFVRFIGRAVSSISVSGDDGFGDGRKERVMVTCTHRSHMDYLILGSKMLDYNLGDIRFAAGDNLTRLPLLGKKFRSVGAFSVFRGKSSQRNYLFKLADQVKRMLLRGNTIIVFPEGGRSYTGKMLDIRSGLIGSAVMAQQEEPETPVYFFPVAIAYRQIPDERYFEILLKGKHFRDKGTNAFIRLLGHTLYYGADMWAFFRVWFFRKKTAAFIAVAPLTKISDITDCQKLYHAEAKNHFLANRDAIDECSHWLSNRLKSLYPIQDYNVIAFLLEHYGVEACTVEAMAKAIRDLEERGANMWLLNDRDVVQLFNEALTLLESMAVISCFRGVIRIKSQSRLRYHASFVNEFLFAGECAV